MGIYATRSSFRSFAPKLSQQHVFCEDKHSPQQDIRMSFFGCCAGHDDGAIGNANPVKPKVKAKKKVDPNDKYADIAPNPKDVGGPDALKSDGWLNYKKSAEAHLVEGG